MHRQRNAVLVVDLDHLQAHDNPRKRLHHVLNDSSTPQVHGTLAGVIDDAGLLLFFVPLFAQVLVPDAHVVGQDDAVPVVKHAVVFAEHLGAVLERTVDHVFKHPICFTPHLDDSVVLVAVHPDDTFGFIEINLHTDRL